MFATVSLARCGSHFLQTSLDQHPAVQAWPEVFFRRFDMEGAGPYCVAGRTVNDFESAVAFAEHLNAAAQQSESTWGVLVKQSDLEANPQLSSWLASHCSLLILLERKNTLRQAVSLQKARATDVWRVGAHSQADNDPKPKVRVEKELLDNLRRQARHLRQHLLRLAAPVIAVSYEELTAQYDRTLARIWQRLGHEAVPAEPQTKKQQTRPLSDVIENYDALRQTCRDTPYEPFFE